MFLVPRAMKRKKHMKGRKGWKNRSQSLGALVSPRGSYTHGHFI